MKTILVGVLLMCSSEAFAFSHAGLVIKKYNPKLTNAQVSEIVMEVNRYALHTGLDPKLIFAVIAQESRFKPNAVGKTHGELGLMQLRPEFHMTHVRNIEKRKVILKSVSGNLSVGIRYLAGLKAVFKDRYPGLRWVEFYNRGPNADPPHRWKYSWNIIEHYVRFGGHDEFEQSDIARN